MSIAPHQAAHPVEGHVVVALSGGVDSAVALMLLVRAGWRPRAMFMKNWDEDDGERHCHAADDLAMAERVCETLGVELETVNLSAEYWDRVFEPFLAEHRLGRTPNPDVLCNREVKFDAFAEFAGDSGIVQVATGHYARIENRGDRLALLKGRDAGKDQTYFLHRLEQAQLRRSLFPVGALHKGEVRHLAREGGLAPHDRSDSTGICFVGERPFGAFLHRFLPPSPGPIETLDGRVLGEHRGLAFHTIGQRHGLGLGGSAAGTGEPWYVAGKDHARGALLVVQGRRHPALHASSLEASDMHWIAGVAPDTPVTCSARIRHRQPDQRCRVQALANGHWQVRFTEPQWAIAPGQSVVLYDGEECLGGGTIERGGSAPGPAASTR